MSKSNQLWQDTLAEAARAYRAGTISSSEFVKRVSALGMSPDEIDDFIEGLDLPPISDEGYRWQDRDFDGLPPAEPDLRLAQHGWRHHLRLTACITLALAACLIIGALLYGAPCDRASNFAPASGRYCK